MSKRIATVLRLSAMLVALVLLSSLGGIQGPASGPYLSALSSPAIAPLFAATHCPDKACATDPVTLKFICVKSTGTSCAAYNSKGPVASKCIENAC